MARTIAQLARQAGISARTLERWKEQGAPMPTAREKLTVWAKRLKTWREKQPTQSAGRKAFDEPEAPAKNGTVNWEEQSRKALALARMHDLAVKRGEFIPKRTVHIEWARRVFSVRTAALGMPRAIAGAVTATPEVRAQIEQEGMRIVREFLLSFAERGQLTPTPDELAELPTMEPGEDE